MANRINIGVYIGPEDTDIAAWFNLLQDHGMSRAKWVRGLFAAYALQRPLPIGTVNIDAPLIREESSASDGQLLFGTGNSQAETAKRDRYGYGWQIRGPNREFIHGSVINVSVSKAEILPVLEEAWANGHQLATFLKALIRSNLEYGDTTIPPRIQDLQKVYSSYMVAQNSQKVEPRETGKPARKREPRPTGKNANSAPAKETPATSKVEESLAPEKTIHFDGIREDLPPQPAKFRNPLLSEI